MGVPFRNGIADLTDNECPLVLRRIQAMFRSNAVTSGDTFGRCLKRNRIPAESSSYA